MIQRLHRRLMIEMDDVLLYEKDNASLAWGVHEYYLDYYLLVLGHRGLHAILPMSRGDSRYVFKLDLHRRQKQWQARYANLEFNPTGRVLYIGTYTQEEVWLVMVPQILTEDDGIEDEGNIKEQ